MKFLVVLVAALAVANGQNWQQWQPSQYMPQFARPDIRQVMSKIKFSESPEDLLKNIEGIPKLQEALAKVQQLDLGELNKLKSQLPDAKNEYDLKNIMEKVQNKMSDIESKRRFDDYDLAEFKNIDLEGMFNNFALSKGMFASRPRRDVAVEVNESDSSESSEEIKEKRPRGPQGPRGAQGPRGPRHDSREQQVGKPRGPRPEKKEEEERRPRGPRPDKREQQERRPRPQAEDFDFSQFVPRFEQFRRDRQEQIAPRVEQLIQEVQEKRGQNKGFGSRLNLEGIENIDFNKIASRVEQLKQDIQEQRGQNKGSRFNIQDIENKIRSRPPRDVAVEEADIDVIPEEIKDKRGPQRGPQGSRGPQGPRGSQGTRGPQGPRGPEKKEEQEREAQRPHGPRPEKKEEQERGAQRPRGPRPEKKEQQEREAQRPRGRRPESNEQQGFDFNQFVPNFGQGRQQQRGQNIFDVEDVTKGVQGFASNIFGQAQAALSKLPAHRQYFV